MNGLKMLNKLNIKVRDTVFDPGLKENKVHAHGTGSKKPMYKVWLYLEGRDLPHVKSVTYQLHPTFGDTLRVVERSYSNPNCSLIIWTWGIFTVHAYVEDKSGRKHEFVHSLQYGEQLRSGKWEYA